MEVIEKVAILVALGLPGVALVCMAFLLWVALTGFLWMQTYTLAKDIWKVITR
jgi:hypothetical protein